MKARTPTPLELARIRECLSYDAETGLIRFLIDVYSLRHPHLVVFRKGDVAGHSVHKGYLRITLDARHYLAHRVAWFLHHGVWPEVLLDHRNRCGSANWIDNLRLATNSQNNANVGPRRTNTSGYKGVTMSRGLWQASIQVQGKMMFIGRFKTPELAHAAYCAAAIEHFGEFARGAK